MFELNFSFILALFGFRLRFWNPAISREIWFHPFHYFNLISIHSFSLFGCFTSLFSSRCRKWNWYRSFIFLKANFTQSSHAEVGWLNWMLNLEPSFEIRHHFKSQEKPGKESKNGGCEKILNEIHRFRFQRDKINYVFILWFGLIHSFKEGRDLKRYRVSNLSSQTTLSFFFCESLIEAAWIWTAAEWKLEAERRYYYNSMLKRKELINSERVL